MKGFELLDNIIKELKNGGVLVCNAKGYKYITGLFTLQQNTYLTKAQYQFYIDTLKEDERILKELSNIKEKFTWLITYFDNDKKKYRSTIGTNFDNTGWKVVIDEKKNKIFIKVYKVID